MGSSNGFSEESYSQSKQQTKCLKVVNISLNILTYVTVKIERLFIGSDIWPRAGANRGGGGCGDQGTGGGGGQGRGHEDGGGLQSPV